MPENLGIIGFANESFCEHITPGLSSIDQQTVQMGKEAFTLLLELINDNKKLIKKSKIVLEPIPYFRESSVNQRKEIRLRLKKFWHSAKDYAMN